MRLIHYFLLCIFSLNLFANSDCFSCLIEINNIDRPVSLNGKWLFTRKDNIKNKNPEANLDDWKLVKAPGVWNDVYSDNKPFQVGWYKANLRFNSALVGQKVRFVVDTYISELEVYLDGEMIFKRNTNFDNLQKFMPIQAIPIDFKITKKNHHLTFRVKTILMKGVYQFPFDLRKANQNDWNLRLMKFFTHDIRIGSSFFYLTFGLLFLFLFFQIKDYLYLFSAIAGLAAFPFFGFPTDVFLDVLGWQKVVILHYIGLVYVPLVYIYLAKGFKIKKFDVGVCLFIVATVFNVLFVYLAYAADLNHELFLMIRKLDFAVALFTGVVALYFCLREYFQNNFSGVTVFGLFVFFVFATHDVLLSAGLIDSILLIHIGLTVSMIMLIYHVTSLFAKAENDKDRYLRDLEELNDGLEDKVEKRTKALIDANQRMTGLAHSAGMAEIATGVLHDIGNILTTVSINREKIDRRLRKSKLSSLSKFIQHVFVKNKETVEKAFSSDVSKAFVVLDEELEKENIEVIKINEQLGRSIESIKNILLSQQQYAKSGGLVEKINILELVDDILKIESNRIERFRVTIVNNLNKQIVIPVHKNKLFHVLINILKNGIEALVDNDLENRVIIIYQDEKSPHIIHFKDNGEGIDQSRLNKIFTHGHTTKKHGHGFGLHASFNAMKEMGGDLRVASEGPGNGSVFSVVLPPYKK